MSAPLTDLELRDVEHFGPNRMSNDTLVRLVTELRQSRAELDGFRCWLRGDQWGCSTDIAGGDSYGYGALDQHGFFEFPISLACVELSRQIKEKKDADEHWQVECVEHYEARLAAQADAIADLHIQLKAKDGALRAAARLCADINKMRRFVPEVTVLLAEEVLSSISAARGEK